MAKRYWTQEEMEYLEASWGKATLKTMATHLNRSVSSVKQKAYQMDLGLKVDAVEGIPVRNLPEIIGVNVMCAYKWSDLGMLNTKKVGNVLFVKEKDLIKFLIEHPNLWDATKSDKTWFRKYDWFQEKLEHDRQFSYSGKQSWTESEDRRLMYLKRKGYKYKDIGKELGRTKASVSKRYWYITGGMLKGKV